MSSHQNDQSEPKTSMDKQTRSDLHVHVDAPERMRCLKQDWIALGLAIFILMVVVLLVLVSTIPAMGAPPLPTFKDPIKGFEPRGTVLSNRIITLSNLKKALTYDSVGLSKGSPPRRRVVTRKRRNSQNPSCRMTATFVILAFQSTSSSSLFTAKALKAMCHLEKNIMKSTPGFDSSYIGNCPNCCPSLSLGNLVARFRGKTSCANITDLDVTMAMSVLQNCSIFLAQGKLNGSCYCTADGQTNCKSVPCVCSRYGAVYKALQYLADSDFLKTPDATHLNYALVMSPIWGDYDLFYQIYTKHLKDTLPDYNGVKVVGFDFRYFKFDLFNVYLIENAKYPGIAMVLVLVIMCLYLRSIILSFCALLSIIFALVLSYFFYIVVFGLKFFPFLNVITFVFLVGIGADDAFVYYDIWRQTKRANPNASMATLTWKTLRYAALSMFVTSFTTSAAFFANVTSNITSIKCFGIFAGLSVLTNYLMMVTWFPVVVVLHERWVRKRTIDQNPPLPAQPVSQDIVRDGEMAVHDEGKNLEHDSDIRKQELAHREQPKRNTLACLVCWGIDFPCHFIPGTISFIPKLSQNLFEKWLPNAVLKMKLHFVWIFLFVGLTVGFLVVSLVKPGLGLPSSKDFQVFSSTSTLEQYDLQIKNKFRFNQKKSWGLEGTLVMGLKELDNGNYLDPDDRGTLQFDYSFDPFTVEAQKWMLSLCRNVRKQKFYSDVVWKGTVCDIETFIRVCTTPPNNYTKTCCSNNSFPFPKELFQKCALQHDFRNIIYNNESKAVAMTVNFYTNVGWTAEYDKMDTFWNDLRTWGSNEFSNAPPGLRNGWIVSDDLQSMYSLQASLQQGTISSMSISVAIAFGVMLLTTLNIFISLYAILSIVGIIAITVGSLVLLGWKLSILESIVMSVAVGLSIDFTMHYGVAYRLSPQKDSRELRVRYSFVHIGSAILMAAVTTFCTGLLMMPAIVLVYNQLGQFLMLVMVFSWLYATFGFLSFCAVIGPVGNFGQLSLTKFWSKIGPCRVKPEEKEDSSLTAIEPNQIETRPNDKPLIDKIGLENLSGDNVQESHL